MKTESDTNLVKNSEKSPKKTPKSMAKNSVLVRNSSDTFNLKEFLALKKKEREGRINLV